GTLNSRPQIVQTPTAGVVLSHLATLRRRWIMCGFARSKLTWVECAQTAAWRNAPCGFRQRAPLAAEARGMGRVCQRICARERACSGTADEVAGALSVLEAELRDGDRGRQWL